MKYRAPRLRVLILLLSTVATAACGNAISELQEFFPNDPPVIDTETITVTDANGNPYDRSNILRNSAYKLTIAARDPEKAMLTYSFASMFGATSQFEQTESGCSVVFTVTTLPGEAGTAIADPIVLNMTAKDIKGASASTAIDIGTRRATPPLTLSAITPSSLRNDSTATFTFSTQADGWFQLLEHAAANMSAAEAQALMTTATRYTSGDSIAATVAGPGYAGVVDARTVKVSAGDGAKNIWVIFRDNNNSYTCAYATVTLDTLAPTVTGTTPANNAASVSTSPVIEITFSEPMDAATLSGALTISGGAGTVSYSSLSGTTARYTATGLAKNTTYTASIAGAQDMAGNVMTGKTFSFTTTPTYALTYDANGGSFGIGSVSYEKDELATVSPTLPTRGGYAFNGWKDSSGSGYTPGTTFLMPAKDITLIAQWTANTYSISFLPNATTGITGTMSQQSLAMDVTSLLNPNTFSRVGHTFLGWSKNSEAITADYGDKASFTMTAGDVTLYAIWSRNSYVVSYVCSGQTRGIIPTPKAIPYGETVSVSSFDPDSGYLSKLESTSIPTSKGYYTTWSDGTTTYPEGGTFIMPAKDVMLTVNWNAYFEPQDDGYGGKIICRGPSGGYIVSDKGSYSSGWRYMEVAETDQSDGCVWWTDQVTLVSGTSHDFGYGLENTALITSKYGSSISYAALLCSNYYVAGYDDWFLPSKAEMEVIRMNIKSTYTHLVCNFGDKNYWTSSESSASSAYFIRFQTTWTLSATLKNNPYGFPVSVRAVRRF